MPLPEAYRTWSPQKTSAESLERAQVKVAILLTPLASLANVLSVFEDLAAVNHLPGREHSPPPFAARIVSEKGGPYTSLSGATLLPHGTLDDFGCFDAVVMPVLYDTGYLSQPEHAHVLCENEKRWLRHQHSEGALFSTMCSGVFPLSETGLLDGASVSMHPLYEEAFRARFPAVTGHTRRSLVVSGPRGEFISGGYSTYSADVSLTLISRFHGPEMAIAFGSLYKKDWQVPLGSPDTRIGKHAKPHDDMMVRLAQRFMESHLSSPSLVSAAAALAHLDERTFCRRFTRATGIRPSSFIAQRRMDRAGQLLAETRLPVEDIASRVGYRDRASFSKAFKLALGTTPAAFRRKVQSPVKLLAAEIPPVSESCMDAGGPRRRWEMGPSLQADGDKSQTKQ